MTTISPFKKVLKHKTGNEQSFFLVLSSDNELGIWDVRFGRWAVKPDTTYFPDEILTQFNRLVSGG